MNSTIFTDSLSKNYGAFYTPERKKIISDRLFSVSSESLKMLLEHILSESKQAPTPREILDIASSLGMFMRDKQFTNTRSIYCKKCKDTGILLLKLKEKPSKPCFAYGFCRCGAGDKAHNDKTDTSVAQFYCDSEKLAGWVA